jgi:hypothetical protein
MVIPERIRLGGDNFFNTLNTADGIVSKFASMFSSNKLVDQAQDLVNYLESVSATSLFSIDQLEQKKLLKNKAGITFSIVLIIFVTFFYFFSRFFKLSKKDPIELRYEKFIATMKKNGFHKSEFETAGEFAKRVDTNDENLKEMIAKETNYYIRSMYERKK